METSEEQVEDDVTDDSETQTETTAPLPTPPRPCPGYQTYTVMTDDPKSVDTEAYYSDVKPEDKGEEDLDTNRSIGFPVDNLVDKIDLSPVPSNTISPSDQESWAEVDPVTTNTYVKDGSQVDLDILDQNLGKENKVDDVVKTVYKIHQGEICEKVTV